MQRGRLSTGYRLRFDNDLAARLQQSAQPSIRPVRALILLAALGAAIALVVWAFQFIRLPSVAKSTDALAHMSRTIIEGLRSDQLNEALAVCADSEAGRAALQEDNPIRFKPSASPAPSAAIYISSQEFLTTVRAALVEQGLAWEQVRPLAFGGALAKVLDTQNMKETALAATGAVYFASGNTVYALELTARCCKSGAVVTDFWKCAATTATPRTVKQYVGERFQAFEQEPLKPGERAMIRKPRQVFIWL
jgi:hypothetical protein